MKSRAAASTTGARAHATLTTTTVTRELWLGLPFREGIHAHQEENEPQGHQQGSESGPDGPDRLDDDARAQDHPGEGDAREEASRHQGADQQGYGSTSPCHPPEQRRAGCGADESASDSAG